MGQEISLSDFKIPDLVATNNEQSNDVSEDVHLFLPFDIINEINKNSISLPNQKISNELSIAKETLINQIRNDIFISSNLSGVKEFDTKMSEIIKKMFDYIETMNTTLQNSMQSITKKQEQLKSSYAEKLKDDENEMTSIFSETFIDSDKVSDEQQIKELSFFAVQSLITMLLMLLTSVHKSDSTIVHQMLNLTNQLVEQIPLNSFSSDVYKQSNNLFKSLKPLTNYIQQLSIQSDLDPIAANQSIQILFHFSVIKASFKDILPLINKFIFNTNEIFDIRKLFVKLNKQLTMMIDRSVDIEQKLSATVEYLQLIEAYPNTQLIKLNENKFTGQFICSVLLVHIDLHNQFYAKSKFERGSINGSFSFELEPQTFKYLYEIIVEASSDTNLGYIINVCLRLFTTHLQFLLDANLENFHEFLSENDIEQWFTLISKLVLDDQSDERKKEGSRALIYLIETLSFGKMLTFIHKHIVENQHPILIDQLLNKLNQQVFIYKWIEILCDNQHTQDRTLAYTVLHSFIDIIFKSEFNSLLQILIMFQELLLVYFNNQSIDIPDELELSPLSTLAIEYTTHVIKSCLQQEIKSILFSPLLLGLCTLTESKFNFAIIQPIFGCLMPLFAENIDVDKKTSYLISWLLGKMSHRLIVGPPQSPLEIKYNKILKFPLFSGGYETLTTDKNPYLSNLFQSKLALYSQFVLPFRRQQSILDNDFLISIYDNTNQGAKLISKMRLFFRDKQHVLQQSIEDLANAACAALFAVYIKHYRRIDLAQQELMQPIQQKPHGKLLKPYQYANEVRTIFARTKGRGGNCLELCKKIKDDALLLLESIRESSFIAKIKEEYPSPIIMTKKIQFQRQQSRWTKAKSIIRLLRNTLNACIRLKYLMLQKKRAVENKQDSESVMHRAISNYLYGNENIFTFGGNEIVKCLTRQYQRAMTRLITYRFIEQLIIPNRGSLNIFLFINLKDQNLNWHYLENIQASNYQLKEDIGHLYYQIIKNIFSFSIESNYVFNLINLNYDSMDLCFLNKFQFVEKLFNPTRFPAFNWFRLVVFKLCENIQLEELRNIHLGNRKFHRILQQQSDLIFNKFILTELKQLTSGDRSEKNTSLHYFPRSSNFDIIDQYLFILLRCVHLYDHIRFNYATMDYIEQIFHLYETSQSLATRILTLKILRDLLIYLPDDTNRFFIENLLTKILFSIGQNFNLFETEKIDVDIIIEFIYIYRTIISSNSPWQKFATKLLVDAIKFSMNFNFKSLETVESQQMNSFLASLCILGGYVQPFCLGSTVEIFPINPDREFAVIIEINSKGLESDSSDVKPYLIQYASTHQTEWISLNQMRIIVDVKPPNLLLLPIDNAVHIILDTLAFIVETIERSTIDSFILLDIKYRAVKALFDLLNSKQIIEIFMEKAYASIVGKLSCSMDHFDSIPNDLRLFNRVHLEEYYLSLERYRTKNQIRENKFDIHNQMKILRDPIILEYLSEISSIDDDWKPIATKNEIKSYKKGRLGNDNIQIICLPMNDNIAVLEECGIKHKFKGRVHINHQSGNIRYRTFILDEIEFNEGKWFFCVRFPRGGAARIGWATKGFHPSVHDSYGIGDDIYSWAFDGEREVHENRRSSFYRSEGSWDEDDVCGCGIEIDGENTNIKYWINGIFKGTIYSHSKNETIKSKVKTDLLPNGIFPTYFPAVTVKLKHSQSNTGVFEFIFSPEDMTKCPLPKGYKPVLMPKLLTIENLLAPYPCHAYLIGNDIQQYFYTSRCSKTSLLRDFVNDQHLEVPFNVDTITTNDGFLFSIDNHQQLTISFDFEDLPDLVLFTLDDATFSIHNNFIDETSQHVAILFEINSQAKVYINNKLQTLNYYHSFDPKINPKLNLQLNVGIKNLGIWKYLLSEEHIQRLFTYGLSYVARDYHKLNEYQQRVNTIQFKPEQKYFINEILVPFNQPFNQDLWKQTKQSINHDESNYFKTIPDTNQSVVQLFGNKTYLVLNTANQEWSEYTLIIDIYIPNFPSDSDARFTLLTLDEKSSIYVTHDGHIHVTEEHQSSSTLKFEEYIRLLVSVQQNSIHIYVNGCLELQVSITEDQFSTKLKRIDLFRELDLTKNTTHDDQLRIQCRSITYLNKSTQILSSSIKKLIQSSEYSLDQLVAPSFNILSTSLIGIGYKEQSIEYIINKYNTKNIYLIDNILRQEIENTYQQQKRLDVLRRLTPYDENGTLKMLIENNNDDDDDVRNDLSISILSDDETPSDKKWFYDTVRSVGIRDKLDDWLQDKEVNHQLIAEHSGSKLLDLAKVDSDQTEFTKKFNKSLVYEHRQIPLKSYIHSRKTCEYGLITIYARHTILNMLKVWSNDDQFNLFPLYKFGDAKFLVKLLLVMHHHQTYARLSDDRMDLLAISIITHELKDLLECITNEKLTVEILNRKAPVFFQLQKQVIEESIDFLSEPSLIDINNNNDATIDEQIFIKQPNLNFLLKIFDLFSQVLKDFQGKTYDIDSVIRLLFPGIVIKILFDLFLLVPSHQSKIFVLGLFTKLIQSSENLKLHDDIHNFLHNIFMEILVNEVYLDSLALKYFRRPLMHLELTLMERENQLFSSISEWSSFMKDLAITIDLINILTNKMKTYQWPELFFTESKEILGEKFALTKEMVETAHTHFDRTADEQLIKFMNENLKIDDDSSFHDLVINLIESLPAESIPDSTKYDSFPCLCNIPSVCIQTRVKFLYLFNVYLENILPQIDFSVTSGIGFIVDRIRSVRYCILFLTKSEIFNAALVKTVVNVDLSDVNIKFDIVKGSVGEQPEDTIFYQAYRQLKSDASRIFRRKKDERAWKATYVGMFSNDQGGPYRDSVTRICNDLCSTRLELFILCPNGRTNNGLNRDRWIPNVFPPNRSIPVDIKHQYRFVGQLMGMAIRTKQYLDIQFPILLWKQLIHEEVTIEDIEAIDISSFTILNNMEENIRQVNECADGDVNNNCNYLFSSIMTELTFDVVSSTGQTYELIPGGFHVPITAANFESYCMHYRQYRIKEFYRQIEFIRQGLYSVVPWAYLTLFTAHQLEEAVCGKGYIDVQMLKRHTDYEEYQESSPCIQLFWTVLSDMFTEEQKKLFLKFVWGRTTLPYSDNDFSATFTITRLQTNSNVDQALPKSYTCSFTLQLPEYSTKEIMYERLNYAITYCSCIDADGGRMN